MQTKKCSKCQEDKPLREFNKRKASKDGLQAFCRACSNEDAKEHYNTDKQYYKDKNNKRRKEIRDYILSKKVKCSSCDETHQACLDFHHLQDKKIDISIIQRHMWSNDKIDEEINKCVVLCANCHRKLHYEEKQCSVV